MTIGEVYHAALRHPLSTPQAIQTLLADVLGYKRLGDIFLHLEDEIPSLEVFQQMLDRFDDGEPVQYITKKAAFGNLSFYVDEAVLIPRPETEELITIIDRYLKVKSVKSLVDLGTGSGCIAIHIKKHHPELEVYATDMSLTALEVARKNADTHQTDVMFLSGNWLEPLIEKNIRVDVIISNPPYIENPQTVARNVLDYEPHSALFAPGGIANHQLIIEGAHHVLQPGGLMLLEIDEDQGPRLVNFIRGQQKDAKIELIKDLRGKYRFIAVELLNEN